MTLSIEQGLKSMNLESLIKFKKYLECELKRKCYRFNDAKYKEVLEYFINETEEEIKALQ